MGFWLGNKPINTFDGVYLGNVKVTDFVAPTSIPQNNLIFWLDPSTFTTGSTTWVSNYGLSMSGSMVGATPVKKPSEFVVNFTTSSAMTFGGNVSLNYTSSDYTMFVTTRYSGSSTDRHGRLIDALSNNWLMPTYGGDATAGTTEYWASYYNTTAFIIQSGSIYDTNWRISTVVRDKTNLSSSFFINGQLAASGSNNATTEGFNGLTINKGLYSNGSVNPGTGEVTQADVGDIILYNRVLTNAEINSVYQSLRGRYGL